MADEQQGNPLAAMAGKKFLYKQPEISDVRIPWESWESRPLSKPFEFRKKRASNSALTMVEISSAQRHYPIVFSNVENPVPMAVCGLAGRGQSFRIDENGRWDPDCYVPSYLRCYPFAFACAGGRQPGAGA